MERQLTVSLSHSRSEAEGSAQRYCQDGLAEGYYLECTVDTTPDGDVVRAADRRLGMRTVDPRPQHAVRLLKPD